MKKVIRRNSLEEKNRKYGKWSVAAQIVTVVEFLVRMCRLVKTSENKPRKNDQSPGYDRGDISELLGKDGLFSR